MSDYRVSAAYAKSLITLSQELDLVDTIYSDMVLAHKVMQESREFRLMLKSPIVSHFKKLTIIEEVFAGKITDATLRFFKLITKKKREALLASIVNEYIREYKVLKGIQTAMIITAVDIDAKLKNQLSEALSGISSQKMEISYKVDASILGGYIISTGDRQIDASIKSQLQKIKIQFTSNPYVSKY